MSNVNAAESAGAGSSAADAPVVREVPSKAPADGAVEDGANDGEGEAGEDNKAVDDELAAMFGGMKKKKKASKKTQFAVDLENLPARRDGTVDKAAQKKEAKEAAAAAAAAAAAPAQKEAPAAEASGEAAEGADGDLNFGELKKKKKKSKSTKLADFEKELAEAEAAQAAEKGGDDDDDDDDDDDGPAGDGVDRTGEGDLGDNPFAADDGEGAGAAGGAAQDDRPDEQQAWIGSDRDYAYPELLGRIFRTLRAHNPALSGDKKKYSIVPPAVQREGSKRTMFANSLDICKRMRREPEHVYSFLFAELGTIGNIDGNQRLIIKGRFQPKQVENVLRKYIVEYVTCKTCKSPNTELSKKDRLVFMTCKTCGSTRTVNAIKTGFLAITGKRSRLRAAA